MSGAEIRVLVVDDDFRVAALHAEFVGRVAGFRVEGVVHTAAAALENVRAQRPDLVLLDLYLPDVDGLELLSRFRDGAGPHPDVIAVTAARDMPSVHVAMQRGAIQYLVKPFPFRALSDRLQAFRSLWLQTRTGKEVGQSEVDWVFGLMRSHDSASVLPKGCSEATMALVRAAFADPDSEWSATDIAARVGISRTTAQRYLAHLSATGAVDLHLRYGSAGRPEHRYRVAR